MKLEAGEQHANPMGTLHGGILCDLADAAMGMAFFSTCAEGESFTTLELKINFLRPFWTGTLLAHGWVVQRGRTVGMTECDVVDEQRPPDREGDEHRAWRSAARPRRAAEPK